MLYQQFPKMNRVSVFVFILIGSMTFSCKERTTIKKIIEEVLNSKIVTSELSQIDSIPHLQFVHTFPKPREIVLDYNSIPITILHSPSILDDIKSSQFRRNNKQLVVLTTSEIKKHYYDVNLYHPNSGLLLVSKVTVAQGEIKIIDTKVQSI